MKKEEGIVIIDENTIYEIDTECMECKKYGEMSSADYDFIEESKKNRDSQKSESWQKTV